MNRHDDNDRLEQDRDPVDRDSDRDRMVETREREGVLRRDDERTAGDGERPMGTADLLGQSRRERGVEEEPAPIPLIRNDDSAHFRRRWDNLQISFVDEPRQAVQQADELVADVIRRITESFAQERENLEHQWARGEDVSTEELRLAMRRYRSFFDRLLNMP